MGTLGPSLPSVVTVTIPNSSVGRRDENRDLKLLFTVEENTELERKGGRDP